jgi:hypothetical protein
MKKMVKERELGTSPHKPPIPSMQGLEKELKSKVFKFDLLYKV